MEATVPPLDFVYLWVAILVGCIVWTCRNAVLEARGEQCRREMDRVAAARRTAGHQPQTDAEVKP
jgi:hypothetical protein